MLKIGLVFPYHAVLNVFFPSTTQSATRTHAHFWINFRVCVHDVFVDFFDCRCCAFSKFRSVFFPPPSSSAIIRKTEKRVLNITCVHCISLRFIVHYLCVFIKNVRISGCNAIIWFWCCPHIFSIIEWYLAYWFIVKMEKRKRKKKSCVYFFCVLVDFHMKFDIINGINRLNTYIFIGFEHSDEGREWEERSWQDTLFQWIIM